MGQSFYYLEALKKAINNTIQAYEYKYFINERGFKIGFSMIKEAVNVIFLLNP